MTDVPAVVTPFDPKALGDQLKDKIHVDIASLMPDEMWAELLQGEINSFLTKRTERHGYNNQNERVVPSRLSTIVESILTEMTKAKVKELLSGPDWVSFWDGTEQKAGAEIKKLVVENADKILGNVLQSSIQAAVEQMQYNLSQ
jgi:hypothetical protein